MLHSSEDNSTPISIAIAIFNYSLCSSTLLVANKLALQYLPFPSILTFVQLSFSVIIIYILKAIGFEIDNFEWDKIRTYLPYNFVLTMTLYSNVRALQYSNLDTVIVFRSCSPIVVTIIEYLYMERAFPSPRSIVSLLGILFFAILYCLSDEDFLLNGITAYKWAMLYLVMITVEMTYGKGLISTVKMTSIWGSVLYANALSLFPMFILGAINNEFDYIHVHAFVTDLAYANTCTTLLFTCIGATLIGYTGWQCRGMISATSYTLVGVVSKFVTIFLNMVLLDGVGSTSTSTVSAYRVLAVCGCLASGLLYEQAPRVDSTRTRTPVKEEEDEGVSISLIPSYQNSKI